MAARDIDSVFTLRIPQAGEATVKVFPEGSPPVRVAFTRRVGINHVRAHKTFQAAFDIPAVRGEPNVDVARRAMADLEQIVRALQSGRIVS